MKCHALPARDLWMLFFLLLLFTAGCAKAPQPSLIDSKSPADQAFLLAEKAYAEGRTQEASEAYTRFIQHHPDHENTPTALFKLSTLHIAQGNVSQAQGLLDTLIRSFPQSKPYQEALLARCNLWYTDQQASRALSCIRESEARIVQPDLRIRLGLLRADTLAALNHPVQATESLMQILQEAPRSLHSLILEKILTLTESLGPDALTSLVPSARKPEPAATLNLALGLRLAESGRYRSAEKVLKEFLSAHPFHTKAPLAKDMIATIAHKEEVDPLAIGCLLPLSGRFEPFGLQALRGVEMAMALYAQAPGALPVRILIEDTHSDETATAQAIRTLNEKQVIAAIGPLAANPESFQLASDLHIPLITLTQQEGVTRIGPGIFRNFMTPAMQVQGLVSHAMTKQNLFRFAILHPDDTYGQNFRDLFWDAVENMGGRITGVESYPARSTDFSEPIRRLTGLHHPPPKDRQPPPPHGQERESGPPKPIIQFDALFIPDSAERAGLILPQLAYNDVEGVRLLGTNLWHSPRLMQMAGAHARGALIPTGFFVESTLPQTREFVQHFRETYGEDPGYLEAVVFDSLMLLFHALEQKPFSRTELREILQKGAPHEGVTGVILFSETREALTPPFLLEIRGSAFREITP